MLNLQNFNALFLVFLNYKCKMHSWPYCKLYRL